MSGLQYVEGSAVAGLAVVQRPAITVNAMWLKA